ncbi:hypothetical protein [Aureliella helgolandensis]|uniref:Uncharacterized protein n=1 Tax=Aureliella helgolandensis TaxID=2527968 RepID=A0A518G739_9BACT|nr:hypothetical protein [Aureliella helgolandensis]QDV24396.1 hypothetical protein Q31a_27130 [Aureliella helgolandensis]
MTEPTTYGHSKGTAERLTEIANLPGTVSRARTQPLRRPQLIGGDGGEVVWGTYTLTAGMTNEGDYYEAAGDVVEIPGGAITTGEEIRAYVDTAYAQVIGSKGLAVQMDGWWMVVTPECATPPFEYVED